MKIESLKAFPLFLIFAHERMHRGSLILRAGQMSAVRQVLARISPFVPRGDRTEAPIHVEAMLSGTGINAGSITKEFEVILMDRSLKRQTFRFPSEQSLVQCLKDTYTTHAPVRITYSDGSPIQKKVFDRIHRKLHQK